MVQLTSRVDSPFRTLPQVVLLPWADSDYRLCLQLASFQDRQYIHVHVEQYARLADGLFQLIFMSCDIHAANDNWVEASKAANGMKKHSWLHHQGEFQYIASVHGSVVRAFLVSYTDHDSWTKCLNNGKTNVHHRSELRHNEYTFSQRMTVITTV